MLAEVENMLNLMKEEKTGLVEGGKK